MRPFFPRAHGRPRVDGRRVLTGIVFVTCNGPRWRDVPSACGLHKAHCTASSQWVNKGLGRLIRRGQRGRREERTPRPRRREQSPHLSFFMTPGQVSDYTGAAALLGDMPKGRWRFGYRGYNADWFSDVLSPRTSGLAYQVVGRATKRSDTTSSAIGSAAASRSCSGASKTGVASLLARSLPRSLLRRCSRGHRHLVVVIAGS